MTTGHAPSPVPRQSSTAHVIGASSLGMTINAQGFPLEVVLHAIGHYLKLADFARIDDGLV